MTVIPHDLDSIMFGLYLRERTYAGALNWPSAGCRMTDYDHSSAHAIWDDLVEGNRDLGHGAEHTTTQDLVRQSVRLPYVEPRAHPNTLGGLMTLALGNRITTQDGALQSYRHALTFAGSNLSLSMSAQVHHVPGQQYLYPGLKADTFLLRNNGPFLTLQCDMIGSGARPLSATAFTSIVNDPWLRWGDCHIWIKDVTSTALTLPGVPVQGSTNLGIGALDISSRIVRLEYLQPCHIDGENGYRPSTGVVRGSLYPGRREAGVVLEFELESASEVDEVNYYLLQRGIALEWQCVGTLIQPGGTFYYGFTIILPRLQFKRLRFSNENAVETLALEGVLMDDKVNTGTAAWVYTSQPRYLALLGGCAAMLDSPGLATSFLHCWDMDEVTGNRIDHINGGILEEPNGAVGSEAGQTGLAASTLGFPAQRILRMQAPDFFFQPPFTVAFWTKLTAYPSAENATFVGNGASQNAGTYEAFINMGVFSHLIGMATRGGADSVTHPTLITLGDYHLIVCWHTGTTTNIQIDNGTIASAAALAGSAAAFSFNVGGMGSGTYGLSGAIDMVMVWTRALISQAERDIIWAGGA